MKEKDFNFIFEKQKDLHNSMSFNEISHKINIGENKKYFSKKLAFSTLVLSLLLLFMLTGISVYLVKEERMEYTQAVAFFKKNDLILADLTKAEIKEQIEEIKVQNAAIAYKLTEVKKQGGLTQPVVEAKTEAKAEVKEKFDDFN